MFAFFQKGSRVLGMNARNLDFIRPYNAHSAKQIADNKLLSKRILHVGGIPVPGLLGKIKRIQDIDTFDWESLPGSFVLKPNRGFGGSGIIVVYGKKKKRNDIWVRADGSSLTLDEIKGHVRNILEGSFSLFHAPDTAFFEERLKLHKIFKPYAYKGIPDIRVIVFNKVPVMAMLRLPTRESDGKANLQLGGIGVGIDLSSGVTTTAVIGKQSRLIERLPRSRLLLSGIQIPYWKTILDLAVQSQIVSNLGFLGADIAIDRDRGPVFLEINARSGLSIQIANQSGLKERLNRVIGLTIKSKERGVRVGMNLFGGEVEEELEDISGRKIIGTVEEVKLIGINGKEISVKAKIDTGAYSSSLDASLAKLLGYDETLEKFLAVDTSFYTITPEKEGFIKKDFLFRYGGSIPFLESVGVIFSASGSSLRPVVKMCFLMNGERVESCLNIANRENLEYPMIIGKRDLKKFLIRI